MKFLKYLLFIVFCFVSCSKKSNLNINSAPNSLKYAKGLEIYNYPNFTILKVTKPWPNATKSFTYICAKSLKNIPDSLSKYTFIKVPVKEIVVTSTTHISSVEALNNTDKLVGFPNLNYISSKNVRERIKKGEIIELSDKENLNFEKTINLNPQLIVGLSIDSETSKFNQFEKAGIPVMYNADWVETTPLGKAEWVKFFGVLFDQQNKANKYFENIVTNYQNAKKMVTNQSKKPTVLSGAIFQDVWYAPQGESWMSQFMNDAGAQYIFSDTKGTGSLSLSFETVIDKALHADYWIGPGEFNSFTEMIAANKHYAKFKAFQNKKIYSYAMKKGETGGIIFYEDAPNRPDLVLKDLIAIFYPEKFPNYKPSFIEPLK